MYSKIYFYAIFVFSLSCIGKTDAYMIDNYFGHSLKGLTVLKMGPLDPREEVDNDKDDWDEEE